MMAPESERAKTQVICNDCLGRSGGHTARCPHWSGSKDAMGCEECGNECNARHPGHDGKLRCFECNEKSPLGYGKPRPAEPTLTCSEVVERLAKIAGNEPVHFPDKWDLLHPQTVRSNIERKLHEQAPAILHSWREQQAKEQALFYDQMQEALGLPNDGRTWFGTGLLARAKTLVERERRVQELEIVTEDAGMMIRRLLARLPDGLLKTQARDWLKRNQLEGSLLRVSEGTATPKK